MVPFNVYTRWKEADMGKSIKGKELGKGITQRKSDGLYQGRFVNRFGKTQTIYASSLNELRKRMREEQYEDEKALNVVTKDVTLDEWYEIWMNTCKKNCRNSTKESYATHYKRIQKELGWRKLTSLNLIIMQNAGKCKPVTAVIAGTNNNGSSVPLRNRLKNTPSSPVHQLQARHEIRNGIFIAPTHILHRNTIQHHLSSRLLNLELL